MAAVVFTTKVNPTYDDLPEERYHFPRTYLRAAMAAVGGVVVYYEPRRSSGELSSRGGRQCYFATAVLHKIEPDPIRPDHFYAFVSDYVEFDHPVPFREGAATFEGGLSKDDGSTNKGAFGRAVRPIADRELAAILAVGFSRSLASPAMVAAEPAWGEREIITTVLSRPLRDRAFRRVVQDAYDNRCAVTGLRLVNGGGAAEIEAAHIHAVEAGGPDSPRNGLALSRTVHWMFDRFLFTIEDDLSLRAAANAELPFGLTDGGARLRVVPEDPVSRPHPAFLKWHRARFEHKHGQYPGE